MDKIGGGGRELDQAVNETAHPNGNIFFSTQTALDFKINEILRVVNEIQTHSVPVIEHCYHNFLLEKYDPEEREYSDPADQIREVLVHVNYLSRNDIDICLDFNIASLVDHSEFEKISALHEALKSEYSSDDGLGAA